MLPRHNFTEYFNGSKLIGDDYTEAEILQWYEDEKDAYATLVSSKGNYTYEYHGLNEVCAFRMLRKGSPHRLRACGFGSAFGDELKPIRELIASTVLIDSASSFHEQPITDGVKTLLAQASGEIDSETNSFDLITCLGVLHHIPNVSFVISELYRILAPGGILIVREPTTTMGDWRFPRRGVTKNERGIPRDMFHKIISDTGFKILKNTPCVFPPFSAFCRLFGISPYKYVPTATVDLILSRLFNFNYSYHRVRLIAKFAPASEYLICQK